MAVARYLADTSALTRLARPAVRERLRPLIERGLIATCGPVVLEMLYATRAREDYQRLRGFLADLETLTVDDEVFDRAVQVQELLSERGRLRQVGVADLLIAATAEASRVIVLHYDADFDAVAELTGQPTEWVTPRGTVP